MRSHSIISLATAALCFFSAQAVEPIIVEEDHPLINDPDVLQAMEIFMGMSPEERQETIKGLMDAVGDDPVKREEMATIISKLPALEQEQLLNSPAGLKSSLKQMVQDDEFARARQDAKQQLGGVSWEFFVENEAAILEATIAGGQLSAEDAATFKTDKKAWMEQLRVIWEDVGTKQEL
mmetsp:Transcript_15375/g.18484  ORF Transcript_15375/g.18484 Transcript_15375/m.18484 type:complete len:179 (+) Transcript_15375:148-684(+)|eukprot:CAMPEP_0195260658 /NCGR_PEP_ID=MMETSP0706-20130129/8694_1 /TAXON_ID=33640 /ORGANISM="Asterionellopsis glacialis, Strain CCMP134" /LENGTH=178 /DNA_ID=CAMNT_0040314397 /DNA_START=139 /DNA_END=675 /DNA_ORIENTATION=+